MTSFSPSFLSSSPFVRRRARAGAVCGLALALAGTQMLFTQVPGEAAQAPAAAAPERLDLLTFAQGAIPVRLGGAAVTLGMSMEKAIRAADGDPTGFTLTLRSGSADTDAEIVYQLPAATVFDRFAVPNVTETPSPTQTFTRLVEVHGSTTGPDAGYSLLASGTLATHSGRGQVTELTVRSKSPVRWVKLRLQGGIQVMRPEMFFEFTEIIGNGTQEAPQMSTRFSGVWKGRGVAITLQQNQAAVSGCYDTNGRLNGTVSGNVLRAVGTAGNGVASGFVLTVNEDGSLLGVRSTNRAPFMFYAGETAPSGTTVGCPTPPPAALGCGSVIHGITFDFDSATIRPESEPVLAQLYEGLRSAPSGSIVIEGHTSSEGTEDYNLRLSERRAQAVVARLVASGIPAARLKAAGLGETRPIASNNDENGRSLNRRVEIRCG